MEKLISVSLTWLIWNGRTDVIEGVLHICPFVHFKLVSVGYDIVSLKGRDYLITAQLEDAFTPDNKDIK